MINDVEREPVDWSQLLWTFAVAIAYWVAYWNGYQAHIDKVKQEHYERLLVEEKERNR